MSGVEQQEDALVHQRHKFVDFRGGLNAGAHVVMQTDLHPLLRRQAAEGVIAFRHPLPLFVAEARLRIAEDRFIQPLYAAALLGAANHFRPHRMKEVHVIDEFINGFFPLAVGEKGAEPGVADLNAANIQHRLENRRIARIFAADFAAGKAGQRHFADDLLEGVFAAELRHIIVSPADWGDSQFDVIFVHSRAPAAAP